MTNIPTDRPLTAGDYESLADLHTIKGWLHGLATNPDLNDVVADGCVTTGQVYQQEAWEFAGRIRRIIAALASPPVSERERDLEGALREARTTLAMLRRNVASEIKNHDGLFRWEGVPEAIDSRISDIDRALTAQPAGEPTHG